MEHKLSKHQLRVLMALAQQKQEAKRIYDEIDEAEQEQYAMIIKYSDLPIGDYQIKQIGDDIFLSSKKPTDIAPSTTEEAENIERADKEK